MHIVFTIPELLETVFSNLASKEIKPILTVSQQWSESALDALWAEVDSLWRVCHVLAPMERHAGQYHFSRRLTPGDWVRLDRYAGRVRRLHHSRRLDHNLASSVFDQLARTRLRMDIFPNLQMVSWSFRLSDSLFFLHRGVRSLDVELSNVEQQEVDIFFSNLVSRSPALADLSIKNLQPDGRLLHAPLTSAFQTLLNLSEVSLCFTPSNGVWDMLARLPVLRSVALGYPSASPDVTFADGPFPSLERIALSYSFDTSSRILAKVKLPSVLDAITIISPLKESSDSFTALLSIISTHFPDLITLRIMSALSPSHEAPGIMYLQHLRPLLRCGKLRFFEFSHCHALCLTPWGFEEFASALPHLESLILNCCAPNLQARLPSVLNISDIERLAVRCPNLKRLGLYIHCFLSTLPSRMPRSILSNLQILYVGSSMISDYDVRSMASFLSYVCPNVKAVVAGRGWMQPAPEDSGFVDKGWKEVASLLPFLIDIRAAERASNSQRIASLERENASLRQRVRELEGAKETN